MRFLHTSDLHIGKRVNGFSLLDDQREVLHQIVALAVDEGCGGVLLAGDIYDRPAPGADAVALFDEFLCRLAEEKIQVFAISGNHDSPERIAYLGDLLKASGVIVSRRFSGRLQKVTVTDEHGPLHIYLMPYLKTSMVRPYFQDRELATCEEAVKAVLETEFAPNSAGKCAADEAEMSDLAGQCAADETKTPGGVGEDRRILIAHQFITGAEPGGSEELNVGGLDNISADLFDPFDYVALGHIHGAQKIKRETLRYSGSPLKYSFSEMNHTKSVVIVDCGKKGDIEIKKVPIHLPHEMREVKGSMEELMNLPYTEDYLRVVLTDEEVWPDARVTLMANFPNMMRFAVENSRTMTDIEVGLLDAVEEKTELDLFREFYRMQNGGAEPDERRENIVKEILEKLREERE